MLGNYFDSGLRAVVLYLFSFILLLAPTERFKKQNPHTDLEIDLIRRHVQIQKIVTIIEAQFKNKINH